MFRRCPRSHAGQDAVQKSSFSLFKPLMAVASAAIMFELLPMDFQNWIAPSLVGYEEVYWSTRESRDSLIPELVISMGENSVSAETGSERSF